MPNVIDSKVTDDYALYCCDCVGGIKAIPDDSIGLTVFSPPFPGMYAYSDSTLDMGNCKNIDEMLAHFAFLVPGLLRVTQPSRMCCVHLCQLTTMKSREGYIGLHDYRGDVIRLFVNHGWRFAGEVTIDKNPQIQATRNKERGLLFKTLATDSALMRMALADYMIYFRKDGENPNPIRAGKSSRYDNDAGWITEPEWIEWAAPVWYRRVKRGDGNRNVSNYPGALQSTDGILETDVLNVSCAREDDDERHLCPLQLGVIERCVKLWSAPGDTVLSPFAGIGSEGYMALKLGRRFVGFELKASYYNVAKRNLDDALRSRREQELF